MRRRTMIGLVLVMLGLAGPGKAQGREPSRTVFTTVDEAIERLPPIGEEANWNETRKDWDLAPVVAWMADYVAKDGKLTDEQWRRALQRSRAIRTRERWPVEVPLAASVEVPVWLPLAEIRLYTEPGGPPIAWGGRLAPIRCGNCADAEWRRARYQELRPLTLGEHELVYGVLIERGSPSRGIYAQRREAPPPSGPPAGILWKGTLAISVQGVPTLEDVLPGAHGADLDASLRKLLEATLFDGTDLVVRGDFERTPELASTAVSLELTLFEGDDPRETSTLLVLPRPGFVDQAVSWDLPESLQPSRWSIRVRGRPTDVLKNWDATRYWDGELVIPLDTVPRLQKQR